MPVTYNGIGTSYLFARNETRRSGVCQLCNRESSLKTYDTGHFFVILFVPIIPLGRKKVIDECALCRQHRVMSLRDWDDLKAKQIAEATQAFHEKSDLDSGLALHDILLFFQDYDTAETLRTTLEKRFTNHVEMFQSLAAQLSSQGLEQPAAVYREKAFELNPDHEDFRLGRAWDLIQENRADEARQLLHFLEEPGAEEKYDLAILRLLADKFQQLGDHQQAMELYAVLMNAYPDSANHYSLRSSVKKSEKALGMGGSILPAGQKGIAGLFSTQTSPVARTWILGTALVLLILLGLAGHNEYVRRNRTLLLINNTGQPVTYSLDGQEATTTELMETKVPIMEGQHTVSISSPVNKQYDINVSSSYFDRWGCKPVWLINVNGEAILIEDTLYYAEVPPPSTEQTEMREVVVRRHIDYPFVDAPEQLKVEHSKTVKKSGMRIADTGQVPLVNYLILLEAADIPDQAYVYARHVLDRDPEDLQLLSTMARSVSDHRAKDLGDFVWNRLQAPDASEMLHSIYAEMPKQKQDAERAMKYYAEMSEKEPENTLMLYYHAIGQPEIAKRMELLERILEISPGSLEAISALVECYLSTGDYQKASEVANRMDPESAADMMYWSEHYLSMLDPQRTRDMKDFLLSTKHEGQGVRDAALTVDFLLHAGEDASAEELAVTALENNRPNDSPLWKSVQAGEALLYYTMGQQKRAAEWVDEFQARHLPNALMIRAEFSGPTYSPGNFKTSLMPTEKILPMIHLLVEYNAFARPERLQQWNNIIVQQFEKLGPDQEAWIQIFKQPVDANTLETLDKLYLGVWDQPLYYTCLAIRCQDDEVRAELIRRAGTTHVSHTPPAATVDKALRKLQEKGPANWPAPDANGSAP